MTERADINERLSDLTLEWETMRDQGEVVSAESLCCNCIELIPALRERIAKLERMNALLDPASEVVRPLKNGSAKGLTNDRSHKLPACGDSAGKLAACRHA